MLTLTKKGVNRSFLTKPFWSRWPAIGFILFCSWTLTSLSPYNQAKKKDSKNPTILVQGCQKYPAAGEITTYLISIGWLFCLAFLYG